MKKVSSILWALVLIMSPIWVGVIGNTINSPKGDASLSVLAWSIIGVPTVAVVGIVTSLLVRKKPNADSLVLLGFLVPALIVCACELYVVL